MHDRLLEQRKLDDLLLPAKALEKLAKAPSDNLPREKVGPSILAPSLSAEPVERLCLSGCMWTSWPHHNTILADV